MGIVQANQLDIGHAGETAQMGGIVEGMSMAHANGRYTHAHAAPLARRIPDRPLMLPTLPHRRELCRNQHLVFLPDWPYPGLRRPHAAFAGLLADAPPLQEILVGPDM